MMLLHEVNECNPCHWAAELDLQAPHTHADSGR
jgi:hypothetical protein